MIVLRSLEIWFLVKLGIIIYISDIYYKGLIFIQHLFYFQTSNWQHLLYCRENVIWKIPSIANTVDIVYELTLRLSAVPVNIYMIFREVCQTCNSKILYSLSHIAIWKYSIKTSTSNYHFKYIFVINLLNEHLLTIH